MEQSKTYVTSAEGYNNSQQTKKSKRKKSKTVKGTAGAIPNMQPKPESHYDRDIIFLSDDDSLPDLPSRISPDYTSSDPAGNCVISGKTVKTESDQYADYGEGVAVMLSVMHNLPQEEIKNKVRLYGRNVDMAMGAFVDA